MVKLNRIYTRTGDDGSTGLVDGSRVAKSDALMQAIGDVDEANAAIGVAVEILKDSDLFQPLRYIQNDLFDLGADLATPKQVDGALRIVATQITRLEDEIDAMNEGLEPLTSFILPGGSPAAAALHIARAVTRRAERSAVAAGAERALNPLALAYLNRLSDWLFVAARVMARDTGGEILWVPARNR